MKRLALIAVISVLAALSLFADRTCAAKLNKDSVALFGVWTPIRFNRGQLDDFIPQQWNLGFFEKERGGLDRALTEAFSTMLPDDMGFNMVDPVTFQRISNDIYRKIYNSYYLEDVNQRFNWAAADDYAEMLNVRYAMIGDVDKCDVKDPGNIQLEMTIFVYDSLTNQVVYQQHFTNSGRMAQELPVGTLRSAHRGMSEDIIWFLRNPLGRAALIVYDDFANTLTGNLETDFAGFGVTQPDVTDPTVGLPTDVPEVTQDTFATTPPCSPAADSLVLSPIYGNNQLAVLSCDNGSLTVHQTANTVYPEIANGLFPFIDSFTTPGHAQLALAPAFAGDDIRIFDYNAKSGEINFSAHTTQLKDVFAPQGGYSGGVLPASGDFNGDGRKELILSVITGWNEVKIFDMSSGQPVLFSDMATVFGGRAVGAHPAAGDVDGDGFDDLVVCLISGDSHLRVFKSQGRSISTADMIADIRSLFPEEGRGCYVTAGDFDGDGMDEIAVTQAAGNSGMSVYKYQDGGLVQTEHVVQLIPGYYGGLNPAAGDFDGDGIDELAVAFSSDNDEVRIFRFANNHVDVNNPMAIIRNVFPNYKSGLYISAGRLH